MVLAIPHAHWPLFEARHFDLAARFSRWACVNLAPHESDEGGDGKAARLIFEALGRDGWLRSTSASDGQSAVLDLRAICLLREICGQSSAIADVALSEPWLGALPLMLAASAELQKKYLPGYLAGALLPAFALSEPDAGSDVQALTTSARKDGDHFVINGRKAWTSNCGLADLYVVVARLDRGRGKGDIAAFAVEPDDGGVVFEKRLEVMSPHTVGTWRLQDCRVPAGRLIGRADAGLQIALRALEIFRPTVGAAAIGFARRALDEAVQHSLSRRAFKKPIAEHQMVRAKLADMAMELDAATLLVYRAAWNSDVGGRSGRKSSMAKLYATESAHRIIDNAVQIFGGMGVRKGEVVERLYRHVRAFRIFDGTSEIQKLIIARSLLADASG
ncbi:acyl-CoA dehydrogenase family protein [Bradyrhizobium erythrophlei]|uniref:acyl-CoA dehydrogenase family protein n=1 Tax=Bradyrhizobium erythrophlei TaxID=1437360 RepID=UPI0035EEFAB4